MVIYTDAAYNRIMDALYEIRHATAHIRGNTINDDHKKLLEINVRKLNDALAECQR